MNQETSTSARPYMKFFITFGLLNMVAQIVAGSYNNYLPIILQAGNPNFASGSMEIFGFGLSPFATSLVMSIDNFFAVLLLPILGAWGDKSTKRRELIFLFGCMSAVAFVFLPFIITTNGTARSGDTAALMPQLVLTIAIIFIYVFSDAASTQFRSGFLFHLVPKAHHNKMQSLIMVFGGVGFLVFTISGSILYNVNQGMPFYLGAALLLPAFIGFILVTPPETEKNRRVEEERAHGRQGKLNPIKTIGETFHKIPKAARHCIVLVLIIKTLSAMGVFAIQTFASSYMYDILGLAPNLAIIVTAVYYLGYLLMAVPIGIIADKSNKNTLFLIGLVGTALGAAAILLFGKEVISLSICCLLTGALSSILDVISVPYIMSFAPSDGTNTGTLFSLTNTITLCTSLISVPLVGWIINMTGSYSSVFTTMIATCLLALLPLVRLVRYSRTIRAENS